MAYSRKTVQRFVSILLTGLMLGCHHAPKPTAMYQSSDSNQGSVATLPNYYVNLDPPMVVVDHGSTTISGAIRRKPGIRWTLAGRVDIEFISPQGEVLDWLPALLTPKNIAMDPNVASIYSTTYGYVPPQGSTVRVHFVDSDTAAQEDLEGNTIYTSAGGGGHAAGGAHGGGHGNHSSMNFH